MGLELEEHLVDALVGAFSLSHVVNDVLLKTVDKFLVLLLFLNGPFECLDLVESRLELQVIVYLVIAAVKHVLFDELG